MDSRLFLRRAFVVTLTMFVVGATACVKERTGDDKVPLRGDSPVPGASGGAMSGTAARPEPVLSVESQQALEAGNAAFRRKDYAGALAGYEKAAKLSPEHAAPWMGVYMVARARNDSKVMDAAQAELIKRDPGPPLAPAPATGPSKP